MANTITLASSIAFAQAFAGFRGLTLGTNSEPAITIANIILQTILSPPFTWNWNRASTTFLTTAGVQDYAETLSTFGFLEKASYIPAANITNTALASNVATYTAANDFSAGDNVTVTGCSDSTFNITNQAIVAATSTQFTVAITHADIGSAAMVGTAVAGKQTEMQVRNILGDSSDSDTGAPTLASAAIDDNAGSITFRLLPVPDDVYQIKVTFQKRIPALISSTSGTWAPIPDHYSYIYQWGFLALTAQYVNDARYPQFNQKFVAELLGAAEGLTEEQKNIFQALWLSSVSEQQLSALRSQQGTQARGA